MRQQRVIGALAAAVLVALAGCGDSGGGSGTDAEPGVIDDDFCHGLADGTLCNDGDPCTTGDRCGLGVCAGQLVGDGGGCDDGDPCTTDDACGGDAGCVGEPLDCEADEALCAELECLPDEPVCDCPEAEGCAVWTCEADGTCVEGPADAGTACDDADPCTEDDACDADGGCVGAPVDCGEGDTCVVGTCDPQDGSCSTSPLPDGSDCDDGDACSTGATCVGGTCGGGTFVADGTACDDGDPCAIGETCQSGLCEGTPLECEAPADPCLVAFCDPEDGTCATGPAVDGTECDDGSVCTQDDVCEAGQCVGGTQVCQCGGQPDGTPCDDGSACTTGDSCVDEACLGEAVDCTDLDGLCVKGVCDPDTGTCSQADELLGTPCDDDDACTEGDGCAYGICRGAPLDCSGLDTDCLYGRCEPGFGICVPDVRPDHWPCDDGLACTGVDHCWEGECVAGPVDLCTPCSGKAAGSPCEPDDLCASGEATCKVIDGQMACVDPARDAACGEDACLEAICHPFEFGCIYMERPDGLPCNDAEGCSIADRCQAGVCQGEAIDLCGADVLGCELSGANDAAATLLPLLGAGELETYVGAIGAAGAEQWFGVWAPTGAILDVRTAAHCSSSVDTTLALYYGELAEGVDPEGPLGEQDVVLVPLGADDDGAGSAGWSELTWTAEVDGVYVVRVAAWEEPGPGSYLLEMQVTAPPPCVSDEDCPCAGSICAPDGLCYGSTLLEPDAFNDEPIEASWLPLGEVLHGDFSTYFDEDWYVVELSAGLPYRFEAAPFCSSPAHPALALYSPDGVLLDEAQDTSGDGHPEMHDIVVEADGIYFLRVVETAAYPGPYVLIADVQSCETDADCGCPDRACVLADEESGIKLCHLSAPVDEPTSPDQPTSIVVGQRYQSQLDEPFDVDAFVVDLAAGTWTVATSGTCGDETDTTLEIISGGVVLAEDDDGGEGLAAAVTALELPTAATVIIDVKGHGAATGPYSVWVEAAGP